MCEWTNDDFRINGEHLEIFDGIYSEWKACEIIFCPLCGEKLEKRDLGYESLET